MTLVVADNDVRGAMAAILRILTSPDWIWYANRLNLSVLSLEDLGLTSRARDGEIWDACQQAGAVPVTANRASDAGGLESVIQERGDVKCLPVITIADQMRVCHDPQYALDAAIRLLDFLDRLEGLRGAGRLYIP
jgi:hypothetical protein